MARASRAPGRRPALEFLEDRLAPAAFGYPWPDASHLTVSFVPDGTPLGQGAAPRSALFATLDVALPRSLWQGEVLRALQTWAVAGNVNISLVADSGDPLGTPGLVQGDPRFGDIRIAAAPLSAGSVSTSVPFSPWVGTWSGDLLLNTTFPFTAAGLAPGYDLYSVVLHEAGHSLGVAGQLSDPTSAMFEYYTGPRAGLAPADVAALQALYGPRQPDAFEGDVGNDTLATATPFASAALLTNLAALRSAGADVEDFAPALAVNADLGWPGDVDVYSYREQQGPGFTVTLRCGAVSLLAGRLSVLDAAGQVVASAAAGPGGDVSLRVAASRNDRFFFRVEGAVPGVFGEGTYTLEVAPDGAPHAPLAHAFHRALAGVLDADTRQRATHLHPALGSTPGLVRYLAEGRIDRPGDTDFYRVKAPADARTLSVLVWPRAGAAGLTVTVHNRDGQVIAAQGVPAAGGVLLLDVSGVQGGQPYYVAVGGMPGDYELAVQENAPAFPLSLSASGTLTAADSQAFRGVLLGQGGLLHLEVATQPPVGLAGEVQMDIFDLQGNLLFSAVTAAGQTLRVDLLLGPGAYTIRLVAATASGGPLPDLPFTISSLLLNDPIGPQLIDPTLPPPRESMPLWFDSGFFNLLALTDPYGRPITPLKPAPPVVQLP
jgi:hypothetical protein